MPRCFRSCDQAVAGLVDVLALAGQAAGHVAVRVPVVVIDLHEADAALDHPPGQQGRVGEGAGLAGLFAVKLEGRFRLVGQIGQFRHAVLHAEGQLVLLGCACAFRDRRTR